MNQVEDEAGALIPWPGGRPVLYRVDEAARLLNLSRSVLYEQIRARRIRVVKQGRSTRLSARALQDYVDLLEREAADRDIRVEAA